MKKTKYRVRVSLEGEIDNVDVSIDDIRNAIEEELILYFPDDRCKFFDGTINITEVDSISYHSENSF